MSLFDETSIPILSKALDAYSLRHKIISSNIANIGTTGYRSKRVSFEEQLGDAMSGQEIVPVATNERHISTPPSGAAEVSPRVLESKDAVGADVDPNASGANDVDIDQQMTELARNQLQFKFASKVLGESFQGLEKSIRGTT